VLIFFVTISFVNIPTTMTATYRIIIEPRNLELLSSQFERLFEQEQLCEGKNSDVKFVLPNATLWASKNILCARCSYFKLMFEIKMMESSPPHVIEEDIDPGVFKEYIRYLYCDSVRLETPEAAILLLIIAEQKGQKPLVQILRKELQKVINFDNACSLLQFLNTSVAGALDGIEILQKLQTDIISVMENYLDDCFDDGRGDVLDQSTLKLFAKKQRGCDIEQLFNIIVKWGR
jgi:hypothetical protein